MNAADLPAYAIPNDQYDHEVKMAHDYSYRVQFEDRPDPSDFREELQEQDYQDWARSEDLDPDEQSTARAYEQWWTEQEWADWPDR